MSLLSSMTTVLTEQYPFMLDHLWVLNESVLVQTVWSVAKQFLTEVQQAKTRLLRKNISKELEKFYCLHQLEKRFGGKRPNVGCG
ncbi:MAG: uncharacterized protein KVP18_005060 [Porospora cf. gigantea A]|uniref:uncharacterized protein n=1 Tax=Porospora cf. gigantea A TaxID=2853593 RepID=UPI0035596B1B|nr:MAG: hypothetical protein KVP18_005060 [Porospora cf. gigantea A]